MFGLRPILAACAMALALPGVASAARTVYFADPGAGEIAQFAVGAGGSLSALDPAAVPAHKPRRLAMTPAGTDLYATAGHGVLQFDVAADGRLSPKQPALVYGGEEPHSIAVHPDGRSVYVTDEDHGKVRQYDVGPDGELVAKDPRWVKAGSRPRGVAVSPSGDTAYVLAVGGIVVFDVGPGGALTRRASGVEVPSCELEDLALTPDGRHLYATSGDGRVFQFSVVADGRPVAKSPPALATGGRPLGIAVAPDGSAVHVTAGHSHGDDDDDEHGHGARRVLSFTVGAGGALAAAGAVEIAGTPWKPLGYLGVSPDGRSLFAAAGDGHLFDVGAGAALTPKVAPRVDLRAPLGVVVSPNQAPVASFAAVPGSAGSATRFDASSAADSDGSIVRYDWDFGDGTLLRDGGPSPTHVYSRSGTYTVTLVVTDNEGASTTTIFTGGTVLAGGGPTAQASRQIEVAPAATAPTVEQPPPTVTAPAQQPLPNLGETLVAEPVSGTVRVRLAGRGRFVELEEIRELPLGSTLDTRRGRVEVATERRRRPGRVQRGVFYGGLFKVRQRAATGYVTDLVLRGRLTSCPDGSASAARRARKLWGNANGRFRTRGRHSSGAVRGTRWLTVDRCDGTLTVVREGTVAVRDFTLDRTVLVDAGERYLAQAP
ncbi:MAG TPA: PKD domain-containing protein [Thermoleophilaceae bacterium]|nr:PKD domain-containing protein [Thermoleophilaceae bacterium]